MMHNNFKVVIPARMGSSRFYGKPLVPIAGKAMVLRVVEQAMASGAADVVVATDHVDIYQLVIDAGYAAHMTSDSHESGTDRVAQVVQELNWADDTVVVNVQGDEPAIAPALIQAVAWKLHRSDTAVMSTAAHSISEAADFFNPNVVKVVLSTKQNALFFSRAPIPYPRDAMRTGNLMALPDNLPALRHMGIYAYRADFLKTYGQLSTTSLEHFESLEQLRVLAHGYQIAVHICNNISAPGVDTYEDIAVVETFLAMHK